MQRQMLDLGLTAFVSCLMIGSAALAQQQVKNSLTEEDWQYSLAPGVTTREVTFYSDGTACWAKLFLPAGFDEQSHVPGVVLSHGWTGTHHSIEKYGARFAERGLAAMVIDYRGWGNSDGFASLAESVANDDAKRFTDTSARVRIKRTRLLPMKQVEDVRNAISFLQGEPGVDPDNIGVWGSSFSGGHVITTTALDSRVKAAVGQVPAIRGKNSPKGAVPLRGAALEDAIKRARSGQGGEFRTGFSRPRMVDLETQQAVAEYRPYLHAANVGNRAVLLIVAENEELFDNRDHAYAAMEQLTGPKKLIEVPGITHFEMYVGDAFETSSNVAADWFREHLGLESGTAQN